MRGKQITSQRVLVVQQPTDSY